MQRQILSTNTRTISVMSTAVYILANVAQSNLTIRHNSHDFLISVCFSARLRQNIKRASYKKDFINNIAIPLGFYSTWPLSMELR